MRARATLTGVKRNAALTLSPPFFCLHFNANSSASCRHTHNHTRKPCRQREPLTHKSRDRDTGVLPTCAAPSIQAASLLDHKPAHSATCQYQHHRSLTDMNFFGALEELWVLGGAMDALLSALPAELASSFFALPAAAEPAPVQYTCCDNSTTAQGFISSHPSQKTVCVTVLQARRGVLFATHSLAGEARRVTASTTASKQTALTNPRRPLCTHTCALSKHTLAYSAKLT